MKHKTTLTSNHSVLYAHLSNDWEALLRRVKGHAWVLDNLITCSRNESSIVIFLPHWITLSGNVETTIIYILCFERVIQWRWAKFFKLEKNVCGGGEEIWSTRMCGQYMPFSILAPLGWGPCAITLWAFSRFPTTF